jgi:hypothetical protein
MFRIEATGGDELQRAMDEIKRKMARQAELKSAPLGDLFPPAFMAEHTQFPTFEAMYEAAGVHSAEDFKSLPDPVREAHVRATTSFPSWLEMQHSAERGWISRASA